MSIENPDDISKIELAYGLKIISDCMIDFIANREISGFELKIDENEKCVRIIALFENKIEYGRMGATFALLSDPHALKTWFSEDATQYIMKMKSQSTT